MTTSMIDEIYDLFRRYGDVHYGEDTSQLQHALQCAELARRQGCGDALIAAALLHDIGQFLDDAGNSAELRGVDARHEIFGAAFLSRAFPPEVTEPVRLHVDAKRYLCTTDPTYAEGLSRASQLSFQLQGGPMSPEQLQAFEAEPCFAEAVQLRRFDDTGKQAGWALSDIESYRPLLEALMVRAA